MESSGYRHPIEAGKTAPNLPIPAGSAPADIPATGRIGGHPARDPAPPGPGAAGHRPPPGHP